MLIDEVVEVVGLLCLVALLRVRTKVLVLVVLDCRYEGAPAD